MSDRKSTRLNSSHTVISLLSLHDDLPICVSVVVCSYNGAVTLDQCLRSLGILNYPDYEVIVVDDGSTDDTRAIVARFPHVKAIHQRNHGLSVARNVRSEEHTSELQSHSDLPPFPTRRSSDLCLGGGLLLQWCGHAGPVFALVGYPQLSGLRSNRCRRLVHR